MIGLSRRQFTSGLCACSGLALAGCITPRIEEVIPPGYRPAHETDEGGLWHIMDQSERELRHSRFRIQDPDLNRYVQDIACRLGSEHCADVRVYLVRTPHFNATMAPNGMMQIWSGLLLRTQNEAQLAAIIGHELGHYLHRHSLQRFRDIRAKADFSIFLNMGLAIAGTPVEAIELANMITLASIYAYSRDQEREADDVGVRLMAAAGYRPSEASKVWEQLIAEEKAGPRRGPQNLLFATHPQPEERQETLRRTSLSLEGPLQNDYGDRYRHTLSRLRTTLLQDELRLARYERTLVVLEHLAIAGKDAELWFFEGEVYRLRGRDGDRPEAYRAYEKAIDSVDTPPETWRSLGLMYRQDRDMRRASEAFQTYLQLAPDAPDAAVIRNYLNREG